jgi:hypothetical protein
MVIVHFLGAVISTLEEELGLPILPVTFISVGLSFDFSKFE